jgi:hypothetical protein
VREQRLRRRRRQRLSDNQVVPNGVILKADHDR